ncbi:MAG: hypothetical protein ABS46_09585 [Cytophagaceae bacterium SCN 52-12]|nr:MAG: hypothetical protein ABS46_09585 [Cytophagaceae bacterium SCN 52-12]
MDTLKWRLKGIPGSEAVILQDRLLVGLLKASPWSSSAYGEMRGRMLRFDRKSFGSATILIRSIEGDAERGRIRLGLSGSRAEILLDGSKYSWKKVGWLNSGSVLEDEEGEVLRITGDRFLGRSGSLQFEYSDPAVFLVGLYLEVQAKKWKAYR